MDILGRAEADRTKQPTAPTERVFADQTDVRGKQVNGGNNRPPRRTAFSLTRPARAENKRNGRNQYRLGNLHFH
jgi:hypothetical protein